jgi:hypothetical protein
MRGEEARAKTLTSPDERVNKLGVVDLACGLVRCSLDSGLDPLIDFRGWLCTSPRWKQQENEGGDEINHRRDSRGG